MRTDLGCGSDLCEQCDHGDNVVLHSDRKVKSELFSFPHYVVLDTNVILHQIDVLEEDAIRNVIILTTVLNEVKHRSSAAYKRLLDIIQDKSRGFYVFVNEHHR